MPFNIYRWHCKGAETLRPEDNLRSGETEKSENILLEQNDKIKVETLFDMQEEIISAFEAGISHGKIVL